MKGKNKNITKFIWYSQVCGSVQARAQNCAGWPPKVCSRMSAGSRTDLGLWMRGLAPVFSQQLSVCPSDGPHLSPYFVCILSQLLYHSQKDTAQGCFQAHIYDPSRHLHSLLCSCPVLSHCSSQGLGQGRCCRHTEDKPSLLGLLSVFFPWEWGVPASHWLLHSSPRWLKSHASCLSFKLLVTG